ncbi:stage III sporulation protein AB [Jeotgalibacillus soli]|uniref:Stage III sporulation protein AB n=1 Tax=Jeotgalibacillus soli TaxID=889306 RepID=A0A0C2VIP5_9BACL|nr:stage III sporulation protein AB [Jeotgalibacillus soli]KIL44366.1 hypothetical protein KP78_33300 [Jeotgalibacillus soli]
MLNLLGAGLLVLGSGLEGWRRASLLDRRQRVLVEMAEAFTWMQNEIVKRQTPMIEIIHYQMKRDGEVAVLFRLFLHHLTVTQLLLAEAWQEATKEYSIVTVLHKDDLEWISRVGNAINQFDRTSIDKELVFVIHVLNSRQQEARNRSLQYGKLYKTIGWMGGVLAVLLLS